MKKIYFLMMQTLICLLTVCANATTILNATVSTTHDTLSTCDTNIFHVTIIDTSSVSHVLMIHDAIGNPPSNSCHGSGGVDLSALKILNSTPLGLHFYHDLTNHTWNVHLPGNDTVHFDFNVFIDCGLAQNLDTGATASFIQTWTDTISTISYHLNGSSGHVLSNYILSPSMQNLTPSQFYGNYLDTVNIYFTYMNTGSATAHILFMFDANPPTNCSSDS
ncbi:MAG: hypothetical protein ABI855_16335, partial [Bacteroidota bacterium]